ncbi:MAG TPA: GxxExxY protein [Candidatus Acidoferrales bacterium]|jgi:GxxExxY protein|nr:GxxExxY protein [Candidatus Acidoferrales bacterium]
MPDINKLTEKIIGCAIETHRELGPGLLESTYEAALAIELEDAGILFERQVIFPVIYKGRKIGEYRLDMPVENKVIVEIESVERFDRIFEAQILTYLRVTGTHVGLIVNFNSRLLHEGIKRFIQ